MADTDDTILSGPVAAVADNLGVEYVISFRFGGLGMQTKKNPPSVMPVRLISRGAGWIDREKAEVQFEKLIGALDGVGLRTEVRDGANGNALIFVRVRSEQKLVGEVYRSRCVLLLPPLLQPQLSVLRGTDEA